MSFHKSNYFCFDSLILYRHWFNNLMTVKGIAAVALNLQRAIVLFLIIGYCKLLGVTKVQTNHKGALNRRIRLRSKSDQWMTRWAGLTRSLARHRPQISSSSRQLHCNRGRKPFPDQPLVSAVYPSWRVAETRRSDFERFLRRQLNKVEGVLTNFCGTNCRFDRTFTREKLRRSPRSTWCLRRNSKLRAFYAQWVSAHFSGLKTSLYEIKCDPGRKWEMTRVFAQLSW